MSASVNKVILIGNVGSEPELKVTPTGTKVVNLSIATSYKDDTDWHKVVFFEKLAETVEQYVHKGTQLYVEGRIKYNKWTNKEGVEVMTTSIVAISMQLLGGNKQSSAPSVPTPIPVSPVASHKQPAPQNFEDDVPF